MNYCEVWDCHKEATEYCGKCRIRLCSWHYNEKHIQPYPNENPHRVDGVEGVYGGGNALDRKES